MIDSTFSERGWAWTGKIIEKSVSCLTSVYFTEMRMVNNDDYQNEGSHLLLILCPFDDHLDFKLNHHLWWGKMYRSAELKPEWRTPSTEDIDMALEAIGLAADCVSKIDRLLKEGSFGDNVWSNEFCRALSVIDKVLRGSYNLIAEIEAHKTGGVPAES